MAAGMKECKFELEGVSPISFNRPIQSTKETGETHDAFEKRTWRERLHVNKDGEVILPPQNVKNCLVECAQYLAETIRGKGKATYTKHFQAGLMLTEPMTIMANGSAVMAADVESECVFVPSDGKPGGKSPRVYKYFPVIQTWTVKGSLFLLDPVLMPIPEKIEEYFGHAGRFIGFARFRPRKGGYYGRFKVVNFKAGK